MRLYVSPLNKITYGYFQVTVSLEFEPDDMAYVQRSSSSAFIRFAALQILVLSYFQHGVKSVSML